MYQDRKSRMAGRASIQLDSQGPSGLGNLNGLRHGNFDHFVLPKKNYKSKTQWQLELPKHGQSLGVISASGRQVAVPGLCM